MDRASVVCGENSGGFRKFAHPTRQTSKVLGGAGDEVRPELMQVEAVRGERFLKALCAQGRPRFVRVRRDETEGVELAEREEMPRGEGADVNIVVADDGRAGSPRQAFVLHADQDEGNFRFAERGGGRVVGADAGNDAVRADQVAGFARQLVGGLQ